MGVDPSWATFILIPFLTFLLTSWFLHHCPGVLHAHPDHKRRRSPLAGAPEAAGEGGNNPAAAFRRTTDDPRFTRFHIAHRGCRMEGIPENTLAAFKHALDSSAEIMEFDVWLTSDDKVVVFHDSDLGRMTGVSGSIPQFKYEDLPAIRVDEKEHWGISEDNRGLASRIPTLEEVLDLVPADVPLIIEFKHRSQVLVRAVHSIITARGRQDKVIWFSLLEEINMDLRLHDPTIPTIASVSSMLKIIILYYLNLLPFCTLPEDILGVPIDEVDYARVRGSSALKALPDSVCSLLAKVFGGKPPRAMIPSGLFDHMRRRGMPVFFLGVNDDRDIEVAMRAGATAVLTDRPQWLGKRIQEGKVRLKCITAS